MSRFEQVVLNLLRAPEYRIEVAAVRTVAEHFVEVEFDAPELLAAHDAPPTFWVRLWFPGAKTEVERGYTVTAVRPDRSGFVVGFAVHDPGGPAVTWVRNAQIGDRLRATVYGSKGFFPQQYSAQSWLLAGDPASLPALNDALRALPEDTPARVLFQEQHPSDSELEVAARPGDKVRRLAPEEDFQSSLVDLPERLDGWAAWIAAEASDVRALRQALRRRGISRQHALGRAYWVRGRSIGGS